MRKPIKQIKAVCYLVIACFTSLSLVVTPTAYAKKAPPTAPKIFVLVPGITSELTTDDITDNFTPEFEDVKIAINQVEPTAQFITYSYNGPVGKKKPEPKPYKCGPTLDNTIRDDILHLNDQVQAIVAKQPTAEIYLVGHSLGGVIAYGYMAALTAIDPQGTPLIEQLPNNNLKGVVTLDSPLGGIRDEQPFFGLSQGVLSTLCPGLRFGDITAATDLHRLFLSPLLSTGGINSPIGSGASTLAITFPDNTVLPPPYAANQLTAKNAFVDMGTRTLTIGNKKDMLWNPNQCGFDTPQYVWTQWVQDRAFDGTGVYGRYIDTGDTSNCFISIATLHAANHILVLHDAMVMQAIKQFIQGQEPSALPFITGES